MVEFKFRTEDTRHHKTISRELVWALFALFLMMFGSAICLCNRTSGSTWSWKPKPGQGKRPRAARSQPRSHRGYPADDQDGSGIVKQVDKSSVRKVIDTKSSMREQKFEL